MKPLRPAPPSWLAALFLLASCASSLAEPKALSTPFPEVGSIERADARLNNLIDANAHMEKIAGGFRWSEGPAWLPKEQALVMSDVPANTAYRWSESTGLGRFLAPSGYTGAFDGEPHQGSNGIKLAPDGRILLCQHGDRRVVRLEALNTFTTLADRFEGRRFNSPNDLCATRDGIVFFTDPPYGLNGLSVKPELDFSGVYRIGVGGAVTLVTRELAFPNGIALSPDERTLYVTSSDVKRPVVIAIPLDEKAQPGTSRLFFDARPLCQKLGVDRPMDGLAVDEAGNLWSAGPGGVVVISARGEYFGTLLTGRDTANCAFGGEDGRTLFITAADSLLRLRTKVRGATFR